MYTINHIENPDRDLNYLEISNNTHSNFAKIHLSQGASLQELIINNCLLIEDLSPLDYKETYASSVLFPFANRIKDGVYTFENNAYQFSINEVDRNNALHGLVYNKNFEVLDTKLTESFASVKLSYNEHNQSIGFPFEYSIQLEYILSKSKLDLKVSITNSSTKTFPFTLGWHPYFISKNLNESYLKFNSSKQLVFDNRMITSKTEDIETSSIKIENKQLDDCWFLDDTKVIFETPDYDLKILSTEKNSFLQAYTPPRKNTIAIEPTTGVSDSFNNKIGLKTLKPNKTYELTWTLKLD